MSGIEGTMKISVRTILHGNLLLGNDLRIDMSASGTESLPQSLAKRGRLGSNPKIAIGMLERKNVIRSDRFSAFARLQGVSLFATGRTDNGFFIIGVFVMLGFRIFAHVGCARYKQCCQNDYAKNEYGLFHLAYSHSIVPVGLGVRSYRTLLMPSTSEVMRAVIL